MKVNFDPGFRLHSPSFQHGGPLPPHNSRTGANEPPQLDWDGVPSGTAEFALECHDVDAPILGGVTHWVCYGIPGDVRSIGPKDAEAYTSGVGTSGDAGYSGPMPPPDDGVHHYVFWLYALDDVLALPANLTREQLHSSIAEHVIAQTRLVGTYEQSA